MPRTHESSPPVQTGRILIADDDAVARRWLEHQLRSAGFETVTAADGAEAIDRLSGDLLLALVDLQMPKASGMQCLHAARERFPELPVIVISQFGEIRDAVEAIKQGAFEYITKPVEADELIARVRQATRARDLSRENKQLREAVGSPMPSVEFIGSSQATKRVLEQVDRVASLDDTVLLTGESGTGKSTLARRIHQLSNRRSGPFISVSCAALPRDLVEAELFGHVQGAFTGALRDRPGRVEMAHGGTLFLDEIGDLPLELQPKLLAFLQDRTVQRIGATNEVRVDVRVLCATHQDLQQKCRDRSFREDLYFRLNVLPIVVPPLRDRRADISDLVRAILARIARQRGVREFELAPVVADALERHSWPGNVRELENVLHRATAFCRGDVLTLDDVGQTSDHPTVPQESLSLAGMTMEEIERKAIFDTLRATGGNKKAAAQMLELDEKTIHNKVKRFGLSEPRP